MKNVFYIVASRGNRIFNRLYNHTKETDVHRRVRILMGNTMGQMEGAIKELNRAELERRRRTKEDRRRANKERKDIMAKTQQ